jgi:hypothetical protein
MELQMRRAVKLCLVNFSSVRRGIVFVSFVGH